MPDSQNDASDAVLMVDCGDHGRRVAAVVCRHMLEREGPPRGVIENSDDPDDLQAWCYDCEEKFMEEDGMTDAFKAFNDMAIVCVQCYAEAVDRHTITAS